MIVNLVNFGKFVNLVETFQFEYCESEADDDSATAACGGKKSSTLVCTLKQVL